MGKDANINKLGTGSDMRKPSQGGFDFMGKTALFVGISIFLTVISFLVIFSKGFNYGIDFAGGTQLQLRFQNKVEIETIRSFLKDQGIDNATIQTFGGTNDYSVRFENVKGKTEKESNDLTTARNLKITDSLKAQFNSSGVELLGQSTVGPQIGDQLKRDSLLAVFYSLLLILIYVGLRFDYNFAPGAVLCLFHDVVITLGILVILGKEINVQILAACLTIIGYSLNDTIVIYDRIRENLHAFSSQSVSVIINRSINETLARTIVTSGTTFLSVTALFLFAGEEISEFGFTMMVGIAFGTYSSIYVAAPLVVLFDRFKHVGQARA